MKKITAPNYCKDANIDPRGWRHPRTGELLSARKFTEEEVASYKKPKKKAKKKVVKAKKTVKAKKVVKAKVATIEEILVVEPETVVEPVIVEKAT